MVGLNGISELEDAWWRRQPLTMMGSCGSPKDSHVGLLDLSFGGVKVW